MGKKYTQEQVALIFTTAGCELLSTYYTSSEPVQYRCSCGEIAFILIGNFLRGTRCQKCAVQRKGQKKPFSQEYVEKIFQKGNCVLLDQYQGALVPLRYQCSCGIISFIRLDSLRAGHRCKYCGHAKSGATQIGSGSSNWNPDREQVRQNQEIRRYQHNVLTNCLRRLGTKKEGHTDDVLGYSAKELDEHLRSFTMYVQLVETHNLSIDHILPIKAFQDHGIEEPKIICALSNLQPISKRENSEKNAWYLEEEFIAYCQKHGIAVVKKMGSERQPLLKEAM